MARAPRGGRGPCQPSFQLRRGGGHSQFRSLTVPLILYDVSVASWNLETRVAVVSLVGWDGQVRATRPFQSRLELTGALGPRGYWRRYVVDCATWQPPCS